MADDIVTLALDGEISVADFATAAVEFSALLQSLTSAVAPNSDVEWFIERLDTSSAIMTARAEGPDLQQIESVTQAYLVVGRALSTSVAIPYSADVQRHARAITRLIDGRIPNVRFETALETFVIETGPDVVFSVARENVITARGAVSGVIQTLSNRKGLRFTLYDAIFDKAVSCYLREGQEELMRDMWGRSAFVEGTVTRDPESGRPLAIRRITAVELVAERERGAYRRARGISPARPGDPSPEDAIRRVRDAD